MRTRRLATHIQRCVAALAVCAALALAFAGQVLASGASLSGTLVYSEMSPASRVLVFVVPANVTGEVQTYETITNAQGEWSLGSIPPGEYRVVMIVVPASGDRETRTSQTVTLTEGQSLSLGTVNIGSPTVSEARTEAEIMAEGTLTVTVKTAEGLPAGGAMLTIQGGGGGSTSVPSGGVITDKVRNGPVTLSVTDTPSDSATQVSTTAQAAVTANTTTAVTLTLPAGTPLALPAGITASDSERDLGYLNAERTRWGLPAGLTLDSAWSQACAAHDAYLADNNRLEHPEDASLPGASPAGEWAGLHSILSEGSEWTAEANPWEDAPIHLNQLYAPDLDVVGIDESRERTCTTTWPGIGGPLQPGGTIITYPGDGTSGFPPSELAAELPFVPGKFVGVPEGTIAGRELFIYEEPGPCSLFACIGPTAPDVESATLTGPSGPVEVRTISGNTNEVGGYLTGAIIIPVKPLEANASYTAEVALAPYGELPVERHSWTFRTGPANPDGAWPTANSSPRSARYLPARISKLRVAPAEFPVTRRGGRHDSRAFVSYLDAASGSVSFVVYRLTLGIVAGARCEAPRARAAHKRRCFRYARVYSVTRRDRQGKNSFRLTGFYGHRRLTQGRYRLAALGSPTTASFTIIR
ncbi:MAG TPA: carboxypeptidase-like regulatory domain-containing protein [Solirubrobacteraceae bacterium]